MNKIEGWVKGIDVCKHTLDEKYAISTRGIFECYPLKCLVQKEIG